MYSESHIYNFSGQNEDLVDMSFLNNNRIHEESFFFPFNIEKMRELKQKRIQRKRKRSYDDNHLSASKRKTLKMKF